MYKKTAQFSDLTYASHLSFRLRCRSVRNPHVFNIHSGYSPSRRLAENPIAVSIAIKELGFSLIDLLFTLLLSAILLSLAFPAYRHLVVEVRLLSLTNRLTSAINYARSEALRRQEVVTLCKSKDGKTCTGEWHDGWIVLLGKVKRSPAVENGLLRVYPALNENEFLDWHGSGGRDYVQLNPDGSAYGHNGSFVVCVKVGSEKTMWLVRMSQTGRVRVDKEMEYRWNCNYTLRT